ncbi:MAG TPA: T9SS type A sorting domain-containing protein, partial [Flavobacterium sp.]|nr:T9SS type A sorting domain-containing protein [Flavobacterium sp.]
NNNSLMIYYNNIHLPDSTSNELASHGYISYRIKPKAGIAVNDIMTAQANIFFDFNPAIVTNTVTTTVQATAGIKENEKNSFIIYPNPASGKATIVLKDSLSEGYRVKVTDVLGKIVFEYDFNEPSAEFDISVLKSGIYLVTVSTNDKSATKKLIVK